MSGSTKLSLVFVFVAVTCLPAQFAVADYTLANGSATEPAWVVYSVWRPADANWPAGWRTQGWYEIEPGGVEILQVPAGNTTVYIHVQRGGRAIEPVDRGTRDAYPFWIHTSEAFTVVETPTGDFLESGHNIWDLVQADLYEYPNGGRHTIVDVRPNLPDLPAQHIYNQTIHSVVWIYTQNGNQIGKGSGALIDKDRQLVVTNEHVVRNTERIVVFFPFRDGNGHLKKEEDFYRRHLEGLARTGYATRARVITQNVRNDLAIIQLEWLPQSAREIQHDFSQNVEDDMRRGDTVHILGNPGGQLWHWTQGTFVSDGRTCLPSRGDCLVMGAETRDGNSGGPVLNAQGMLIGILTASDDETVSAAAPTRNIRALLNTVPAQLTTFPPQRTYPKRVFKIANGTGVTIPYQIQWSPPEAWQSYSLETGFIMMHWSGGQQVPSGYPRIQFDHIAGDVQVTYRQYTLETAQFRENNDHAPTYAFRFDRSENRLDLFRTDVSAAPTLSKAVPKENALFANYPNPFNPETWIPYQLAKPAEVKIAIYAADGTLVRTLALGHQAAGMYQSKGRAAYWDGTNALGEPVASGVYFYTLTAGEFRATRKLLVRK